MRGLFSIISILSTVLGSIALLGAEALSMVIGLGIPLEWQYWGLVLFVIGVGIPTVITQFENFSTSKIHLEGHGIQADKVIFLPTVEKFLWWSKASTAQVKFPAYWIEISNRAGWGFKGIEGILPRISWYDSEGRLIHRNNGRWWLSNVSTYQDTSLLQTVNLDPNGTTRLLHFARFWDGHLCLWYRTQDNKEPYNPLPNGEYYVEIELLSNSGQKSNYGFLVSHLNNELGLKQISGWQRIKRRMKKKSPA